MRGFWIKTWVVPPRWTSTWVKLKLKVLLFKISQHHHCLSLILLSSCTEEQLFLHCGWSIKHYWIFLLCKKFDSHFASVTNSVLPNVKYQMKWLIISQTFAEQSSNPARPKKTWKHNVKAFMSHMLAVDENKAVLLPRVWSIWRSLLLWPDCLLCVFQEALSGRGKTEWPPQTVSELDLSLLVRIK